MRMIKLPYRILARPSMLSNKPHQQSRLSPHMLDKNYYHNSRLLLNNNNDDNNDYNYNEDYLNFVNENWKSTPSSSSSSSSSSLSLSSSSSNNNLQKATTSNKDDHDHDHDMFEKQLLELKQEREDLFGFTDDEKTSWMNRDNNDNSLSADELNKIRESALDDKKEARDNDVNYADTFHANTNNDNDNNNQSFSHVSANGESVSMVDVGNKTISRRTARARSVVIFPPEVMNAFQICSNNNNTNDELIGPKGPIFSTAKLAGIMAAKRTSELIPLCHPLPLERVSVDITLESNKAIIECECRVSHKTGVEMEALTGASIAALTIYDMVKAVSHKVQISNTVLLKKTGGKSDVH